MKAAARRICPWIAAALALAALAGCPPRPAPRVPSDLIRLAPEAVPRLVDDLGYDGLEASIAQSLAYLARLPADRTFRFGTDTYDRDHLARSLAHFRRLVADRPAPEALRRRITAAYRVYRSTGGDGDGRVLFTGYYEPVLRGCRRPGAGCRYPVYGRPADLVTIDLRPFDEDCAGRRIQGRWTGRTVVPYPDREAIETDHALAGRAPVLAWVEDPVALFFLHIQGSGRIALAEGGTLRLHYHATNGRPYRSIGRLLIDRGAIPADQMSMQAIRAYLHAHPRERDAVLAHNPSYVFFETVDAGPLGSLGVALTPGRSVATDPRHFPRGALAFVQSRKPLAAGQKEIAEWVPFSRFVLNQDTGGAIRGPGRADLFWGDGPYAELAAGHMQHPGHLYFLVRKP